MRSEATERRTIGAKTSTARRLAWGTGVRRGAAMLALAGAVALGMASGARASDGDADDGLTLLVFERAPYYVPTGDGGIGGLVGSRVTEALTRAEIPFSWRLMEPNGHLRTVEANSDPVCAVGWFRKPEREAMGLFTDPVYQDRPQVVLTRVDNTLVQDQTSLHDLMTNGSVRLGAKLGYSYGPYVDGLVEELDPLRSTVSQDDAGLMRMLLGGRFDYMIVAFEEADSLMSGLGPVGQDIVAVSLQDMPAGNTRHLLCARMVGEDVITRINEALAAMSAEAE